VGDYTDPFTFLSIWRTGDGNNNTGWGDATYDTLIQTATREPDTARRMATMRQAETLLLDAMPIIPIFWRMNSTLIRPEVQNWQHSGISHRCYKAIGLKH
jgi:oligopeptide transport system substrate-binding protein